MIPNTNVEVFSGTAAENDWGDVTFAEGAPVVVAGHIGEEKDAADRDGVNIRRAYIRVPLDTVVDTTAVFRVDGHRWKPLSYRRSRTPQKWVTYNCQRLD